MARTNTTNTDNASLFGIKMLKKAKIVILMLILISYPTIFAQRIDVAGAQKPDGIRLFGFVNKPLDLTYVEMLSFPLVSQIATLECVDLSWQITLNWTGVPLFHLLTLAQIQPEAYDVVFRASDGYSSSIAVEEALRPSTILGLRANGTLLSEISGREGGFRVVVPCKWGYKWVVNVQEVEVVGYDHKGTWEKYGLSDEADMPSCALPEMTPSLQTFNVTFATREFQFEVFTNASATAFNFDYLQKEMNLIIDVPSGTTGFADFIVYQDLLKGPYSVFLDGRAVDAGEASIAGRSFLYLLLPEGSHTARIIGSGFFGAIPIIAVEFNQTVVAGEQVVFDASKSIDDGEIESYEWVFGDGTSGSGAVIYHTYTEEGNYQVMLNATDDDGLSNSATLTVNVVGQPEKDNTGNQYGYVVVLGTILVGIILALSVTTVILLLRGRRKTGEQASLSTDHTHS